MAKKRLVLLRNKRKPEPSDSITSWIPGGPAETNWTGHIHVAGRYTSTDGYSSDENTRPGDISGNIYTSSDGLYVNVRTQKNQTNFYSQTMVGSASFGAWVQDNSNGNYVDATSLVGTSIYNNNTSCFIDRVVGFYCQVSAIHAPSQTSGDNDEMGICRTFRISGVYADKNGRVRVMDMTQGGTKVLGHTWNNDLKNADGWKDMCYTSNSRTTIISNEYKLFGWILGFTHYKSNKSNVTKNCTGRVRYLAPLVSSNTDGTLVTGGIAKLQIVPGMRRWDARDSYPFLTV